MCSLELEMRVKKVTAVMYAPFCPVRLRIKRRGGMFPKKISIKVKLLSVSSSSSFKPKVVSSERASSSNYTDLLSSFQCKSNTDSIIIKYPPTSLGPSNQNVILFGKYHFIKKMRKSITFLIQALMLCNIQIANAYTPVKPSQSTSRSQFFKSVATIAAGATTAIAAPEKSTANDKLYNLSPSEIGAIVEEDLVKNAFLTNGKLTRAIYDEKATFTDEIDTYTLDKWIKGTARLFVGPPGSRVSLDGPIQASEKEVVFRFEEDLMFNIPFKPVVNLSGKVVLERDEKSGLITSYREFWDQDVNTVLKSAKFFN